MSMLQTLPNWLTILQMGAALILLLSPMIFSLLFTARYFQGYDLLESTFE